MTKQKLDDSKNQAQKIAANVFEIEKTLGGNVVVEVDKLWFILKWSLLEKDSHEPLRHNKYVTYRELDDLVEPTSIAFTFIREVKEWRKLHGNTGSNAAEPA